MTKQLMTTAIAAACFVLGAGGATLYTHADTGPAVFDIFENNVAVILPGGAPEPGAPPCIRSPFSAHRR